MQESCLMCCRNEMIVLLLFCEKMLDNESIVIENTIKFSNTDGWGFDLK